MSKDRNKKQFNQILDKKNIISLSIIVKKMKTQRIFITGISTEVGKTIVSSIVVEALQADYWKPIQAGDLEQSDRLKVQHYITNPKTIIHPNSYALQTPMSPHKAAAIDNLHIDLQKINTPKTTNPYLVVEGAGGLLVPLNDKDLIVDLIQPDDIVIVVSRHYLGSINHTLLTLCYLQERRFKPFLIYSGNPMPGTREIIKKRTNVSVLLEVKEESFFDKKTIQNYAQGFKLKNN